MTQPRQHPRDHGADRAPGRKLKVLDLFSGIGGFSLGLEMTGGFETVAFCESDPFCRRVLRKHWPGVPIHEDIRALSGAAVGHVDVITGGFPCQPFSVAGKRRGKADDRYLWPEMCRVISECRPAWVIGENVAGIIKVALDDVLSDLEARDYACQSFAIPAVGVDAPHKRERIWIVAHHEVQRWGGELAEVPATEPTGAHRGCGGEQALADAYLQERSPSGLGPDTGPDRRNDTPRRRAGCGGPMANPDITGLEVFERQSGDDDAKLSAVERNGDVGCRWSPEPDVGRVANGVPDRVDRLRSLGGAVVPQNVEEIGRAILISQATAGQVRQHRPGKLVRPTHNASSVKRDQHHADGASKTCPKKALTR